MPGYIMANTGLYLNILLTRQDLFTGIKYQIGIYIPYIIYTLYYIYLVLYIPCIIYTLYYIYLVLYIPCIIYTFYYIYLVLYIPFIIYTLSIIDILFSRKQSSINRFLYSDDYSITYSYIMM